MRFLISVPTLSWICIGTLQPFSWIGTKFVNFYLYVFFSIFLIHFFISILDLLPLIHIPPLTSLAAFELTLLPQVSYSWFELEFCDQSV